MEDQGLKAAGCPVDTEACNSCRAGRCLAAVWLVFVFAPVVANMLLRTTGHRLLPAVGGSMGPDRADLSLEQVAPTAIVGDVISFRSRGDVVLHRVVEVVPGPLFVTQGDANIRADRDFVRPGDIDGRQVATIPWWGVAFNLVHRVWPGGVMILAMPRRPPWRSSLFASSVDPGRTGPTETPGAPCGSPSPWRPPASGHRRPSCTAPNMHASTSRRPSPLSSRTTLPPVSSWAAGVRTCRGGSGPKLKASRLSSPPYCWAGAAPAEDRRRSRAPTR